MAKMQVEQHVANTFPPTRLSMITALTSFLLNTDTRMCLDRIVTPVMRKKKKKSKPEVDGMEI